MNEACRRERREGGEVRGGVGRLGERMGGEYKWAMHLQKTAGLTIATYIQFVYIPIPRFPPSQGV